MHFIVKQFKSRLIFTRSSINYLSLSISIFLFKVPNVVAWWQYNIETKHQIDYTLCCLNGNFYFQKLSSLLCATNIFIYIVCIYFSSTFLATCFRFSPFFNQKNETYNFVINNLFNHACRNGSTFRLSFHKSTLSPLFLFRRKNR